MVGSQHHHDRWDHIEEKYRRHLKPEDWAKQSEMMKDSTQTMGIGSVLIATVTFGATFALPGGYRADDHPYGGTPTLAGRYAFDAFMMANALAFICSSIATIALMYSGSSVVNLSTRQVNYGISAFFMTSSLVCLTTAFAIGVYMVLAPVAHTTAVAICVLSPLVVIYKNLESWMKHAIVLRMLRKRMGLVRTLARITGAIFLNLLYGFWSFIVIFGWAAYARNIRQHH